MYAEGVGMSCDVCHELGKVIVLWRLIELGGISRTKMNFGAR